MRTLLAQAKQATDGNLGSFLVVTAIAAINLFVLFEIVLRRL